MYYPNQLVYLVIDHLLRLVVLAQHGEELDDIGVLKILWHISWEIPLTTEREAVRTSSLNWSPVPSKQSTIVRLVCVGGMISSRWYLLSTADGNESDCGESSPAGERFRNSGWPFWTSTLWRRGAVSPVGDSDMAEGEMTTGYQGLPALYSCN